MSISIDLDHLEENHVRIMRPVLEGGERGGRPRSPNQEGPFTGIYKQYSMQNILAQVYITISLSKICLET
jgi:hypothetical protein